MANQWMHAGGATWLDAVLYDDASSDADTLLGDEVGEKAISPDIDVAPGARVRPNQDTSTR